MRVKHQLEPMFSLSFYTLTSMLIPANGPLKSTFAHTCCLIQGLLLQTDCGLKLGVDTSRNEGRWDVLQVPQDTLRQEARVFQPKVALWNPKAVTEAVKEKKKL